MARPMRSSIRMRLDRIPTWTKKKLVHVVVEAQRGSRLKMKYEPELEAIVWGHPLPVGLEYPYDWGFVSSTLAEDGDPLDALLLSEIPSHPGVVVPCRPFAVLQLEQKHDKGDWERNDRLILVPDRGGWTNDVRAPEGLPDDMREGLEQFFLSTHFFHHDKARCLGWKGSKAALRLIADAQDLLRKKAGA
jgi:inorganic pyrophosphatase